MGSCGSRPEPLSIDTSTGESRIGVTNVQPVEKKSWFGRNKRAKPSTETPLEADAAQSLQPEENIPVVTLTLVPDTTNKYTCSDGSEYEGDVKNGLRSGYGVYTHSGDTYVGEWWNGCPHGKGKYTFQNNECYEGDYVNGQRHGKGVYTYKDGTVYDGDYVNGVQEGKGIIKYKLNGHVYEGDFKNNMLDGQGVMKYSDSRVYSGQLRQGLFHGLGVMKAADGSTIFQGQWEEGCSVPNAAAVGTAGATGSAGATNTIQTKGAAGQTPQNERKEDIFEMFYCKF